MTITSTTVGKNPLEEMEEPSQSTRVQNSVLGYNLKNAKMISVHFQGKPFSIIVIQVYVPTSNVEETFQSVMLKKLNGSMSTYKTF